MTKGKPRGLSLVPDPQPDQPSREQLERVLTSVTFRQVDRLKRFLNFIVSEALAGRGDQLKEYVIGVQVFDKDSSFDPRADPIVRVQARRLRARLVRYYREEGGSDAVLIELPKGGYTPVFKNRDGLGSGRRSIGTDAGGPEHHRGAAVRRSQRRHTTSATSATGCGRRSSTGWRSSRRCGCSRYSRRSRRRRTRRTTATRWRCC